jgi:hypothetical protein
MGSIRQVLSNTRGGGNFHLLLGDFLDEFYQARDQAKQEMIDEPPSGEELLCEREFLAFAASAAHKLANDYGLAVPAWVFDKRFYMTDAPYFGSGAKGDMRLLFMYKSPAEFKHRNLFVDEHVLSRV